MLEVTTDWRNAILNPLVTRRFRMMTRIDLSGSILESGVSNITTPVRDETAKVEQLADGIFETDYAYASLDSAWVIGDGKRCASNIYGQTGYVGVQMSGPGGAFSVYEELTYVMSAATAINHISLAFDDKLDEYAVDFDVAFFNAAGTEIGRWSVIGNESYAVTLNAGTGYGQITGVKAYKLIIMKWCAEGRTCKVCECYSGSAELVTGEDRLISMILEEASESTGSNEVGSVMAGVLTLALDNSDRRYSKTNPSSVIYGIDMRKKRVQTYSGLIYDDGKTELLSMGTYYIDDWSETDGDTVLSVKATDMMAALDKVTYRKTAYLTYPATAHDLILDVFLSAGFGIGFEMDSAYSALTIPSEPAFKGASCREVLRFIAQLMNGSIFQTRDAQIRCIANLIADGAAESGLFSAPVLTIGPDAYFGGSKSSDNTYGPTRVIVKYGAEDALEVIRNDSTEEAKNGITELTISGNPIAQAFTVETEHFANLAWSILRYCGHSRKWQDVDWRGDPSLEAGDCVTFVKLDESAQVCRMSKQTMTMDGGLRVSSSMRY